MQMQHTQGRKETCPSQIAECHKHGQEKPRGPSRNIPDDVKREIARRVNEEKEPGKAVARDLAILPKTVYRIAGIARGDARFLPKSQDDGTVIIRRRRGSSKNVLPKMDVVMPPCPFEVDKPFSLRGRRLTPDEKYYLACLVNVQCLPSSQVSSMYSLNLRTLERYMASALAGVAFRERGGVSSSIVDEESDAFLRAISAAQGAERPSREEFRVHLKNEAVKTYERAQKRKSVLRAEGEGKEEVVGEEVNATDIAANNSGDGARTRGANLYRTQTYRKYMRLYGF